MRERKGGVKARPMNVVIIGAGKVGLVLGRILREEGQRIVCVVSRTSGSARKGGRFLKCARTSTSLESIPAGTDLVYITTPHSAVEEVAGGLARLEGLDFRRMAVCHASGMLTSSVLSPLAERGATVFSFHPLQTFPRDFEPDKIVPRARGIYFGVDGSPAAVRKAKRLARLMGSRVVVIPPELRPLYHAACVVASNHLTALLAVLEEMYAFLGGAQGGFFPVFSPIVAATLGNVERTSPVTALSGPVARGGVETIAGHLAILRDTMPQLVPYYAAMTQETVRLAGKKGSITEEQRERFLRLLQDYAPPTS
jgi:predicted short-subunit dehydrogenase-like oxidoreductase (DUF2520 family)